MYKTTTAGLEGLPRKVAMVFAVSYSSLLTFKYIGFSSCSLRACFQAYSKVKGLQSFLRHRLSLRIHLSNLSCGSTDSVLELRVWAKGSFESSGLGFCFKHASAKARDGVWERNFEFLYSLLVISKLKVLDAFELMGFGWEAFFGWGLKFALCDVEPVTRSS